MGYFQYFILYNAKCCCSWRKVTASQPQRRPRPPHRHRASPPSPPIMLMQHIMAAYYKWMRRVACPRQETTLGNKSRFSRVSRRWWKNERIKNCDLFYTIKMNVERTCAQRRVCISTDKKGAACPKQAVCRRIFITVRSVPLTIRSFPLSSRRSTY
jgi:hypothetical protein